MEKSSHTSTPVQRIVSYLVDAIVISIVMYVFKLFLPYTEYGFNIVNDIWLVLIQSLFFWYFIISHAMWNTTLGKRTMRLRISNCEGKAIGWKRSIIRSLPEMFITVLILFILPVQYNYSAEGNAITTSATSRQFDLYYRLMIEAPIVLYWFVQVIILFVNKKRRTLHDMLAGSNVFQLK